MLPAALLLMIVIQSVFGFGEEENTGVVLTEEENAYISQADELIVGCAVNVDPVFYTDSKTGQVEGISKDILELAAQSTGLRFRYVPLPSGKITYDYLLDQDIDLIASVEYNEVNAEAAGIRMTDPYLKAEKVIVCRKETVFDPSGEMKIAIAAGSLTVEQVIKNKYPGFQVVSYETAEEAMDAVVSGEADGMLQNQYSMERMLHKPAYQDLRVVAAAGIGDWHSLSPVFRGDEADDEELTLLISILNKGIHSLDEADVSLIIIDQTAKRGYQMTLGDWLYEYRYTLWVGAAALCIVGFLMIYAVRVRIRSRNMEIMREEERKHQFLIEKTDQMVYEIDLLKRQIRISDTFRNKFGWEPPRRYQDEEELLNIWKVHPQDRESFAAIVSRAIRNFENTDLTVRIWMANGTYIWCHIRQFVMPDAGGRPHQILGLIRDVDREILERQRLAEESRMDLLTGLLNKKAFERAAGEYLKACSGEACALVFLDLDRFKQVNDRLGHIMGDLVLQKVARILSSMCSAQDLTARFGGDEFCILMKHTDQAALENRLQQLNDQLTLCHTDGIHAAETTASIGASVSDIAGYDLEKLMEQADAALYAAKEQGRNCYVVYKEEMNETGLRL